MSITTFPGGIKLPEKVQCRLCLQSIAITEAMVGPYDAHGQPTLVCSTHLYEGRQFITKLADHLVRQQEYCLKTHGINLSYFDKVAVDARPLY